MYKKFLVLLTFIILLTGCGQVKDKISTNPESVPSDDISSVRWVKQLNTKYGFAFMIPEKFKVIGDEDYALIVEVPTDENSTPLPAAAVRVSDEVYNDVIAGENQKMIEEKAFEVNGLNAMKYLMEYWFEGQPESFQCLTFRYKVGDKTVELMEYECLEWEYFEEVAGSMISI